MPAAILVVSTPIAGAHNALASASVGYAGGDAPSKILLIVACHV